MLCLTVRGKRKVTMTTASGETITVMNLRRHEIKVGITAPASVEITRQDAKRKTK